MRLSNEAVGNQGAGRRDNELRMRSASPGCSFAILSGIGYVAVAAKFAACNVCTVLYPGWAPGSTTSSGERTLSSHRHGSQVHQPEHFLQRCSICVLRHDVSWILGAQNFVKADFSCPHLFLTPKISDIQISDLSESASAAYAHCCSRIGVDSDADFETKVSSNAL